MSGEYRLRTEWDDDILDGGPDGLYHTLDSLVLGENPVAQLRPVDDDGSFVEAAVREDKSFQVRFTEAGSDVVESVSDADILAVHQAFMRYVRADASWAAAVRALDGTALQSGESATAVDYRETGLTIATAMIDFGNRQRRRGAGVVVPPVIRWGSKEVITGDVWKDVPETGRLAIRVTGFDSSRGNGIAVSAMGGTLTFGDEPPVAELILWPQSDAREFTMSFTAPKRAIGICNVYIVAGPNWSRVDRWSEYAGMLRRIVSREERAYDCNHALTDPPAFDDLSFSVSLT
ncbi:hypothetical protein [Actinoplanes sp. NPDC049118]|uniref:hypothetical protein n=1 Tax=Actinoplanes sp. NPDC049118 TaxID=3155769 RepID=UPI0033C8C410